MLYILPLPCTAYSSIKKTNIFEVIFEIEILKYQLMKLHVIKMEQLKHILIYFLQKWFWFFNAFIELVCLLNLLLYTLATHNLRHFFILSFGIYYSFRLIKPTSSFSSGNKPQASYSYLKTMGGWVPM